MLIILPPSESKTVGGQPGPVAVDQLTFPGLAPTRKHLLSTLEEMGCSFLAAQEALSKNSGSAEAAEERIRSLDKMIGIRATQHAEHESNAAVASSELLPAVERYTGVAYDALDPTGQRTGLPLPADARARLAIGSALFGVIAADDLIPRYRLSAGSKVLVDGQPRTLRSQWTKPAEGNRIGEELARWREDRAADTDGAGGGIIDLRSGGYRDLGKVPGAVSLRVESEYPDGSRKVVSHFNKHYKGLVARELALAGGHLPADPQSTGELAEAFAHRIGDVEAFVEANFRTEVRDPSEVTLIVPAE
ncbi:peroxide stress protein YaaA [Corynebacterium sp. UMB9976]|uniref:YaaA family protein n=1 Tax=Corynebacterium sp. UMB9976 TaxID=3046354 RepID=UPI00254CD554|nr:peroxide stress protein YaaA [Corynebacterium sp. UMB9976]MDK6301228.1 peroxide stress protein YaaA [Corynebacterium sp. UMB9976]